MSESGTDWKLIRDFTSVEPGHSKPKWEYQIIDGGETVALRETPGIPNIDPKFHYIPVEVFRSVDAAGEWCGNCGQDKDQHPVEREGPGIACEMYVAPDTDQ